ncbi:MAG TPA: Holliday junction resolvase RuvX [Dehalococcoidia bacterium]|nr:Holliday junction resolvase RuvX [Dehalococcoidia bacterium]
MTVANERPFPPGKGPGVRLHTRMLGLDVGERRIGVAVSDGSLAVPLTIVEHRTRAAGIERVAAIAREQQAALVVVGLPLLESGAEGEQARRTRRFGDAVARRIDAPVVYHDERYTTVRAAAAVGAPAARRHPRVRIDDHAAAMILQSYIDAGGGPT